MPIKVSTCLLLPRHGTLAATTSVCDLPPTGYTVVDVARTSARSGGVAIIFRKHLKCLRLAVPVCRTMEVICVRLITVSGPIIVMNVYRPGSEKPSALFFDELASVLETLVSCSCPVVVGGDFNVRSQDPSDVDACRLDTVLASFDTAAVRLITAATPSTSC